MRIASLLPSATEIVCALGLRDSLVGISHSCDFPLPLDGVPVLTRTTVPVNAGSREIDDYVRQYLGGNSALYQLDLKMLEQVHADVVVSQRLCDVCAVSAEAIDDALCGLSSGPVLVDLEPSCLNDIYSDIKKVAHAAGVVDAGEELVFSLQERVRAVAERSAGIRQQDRPRVAMIEWLDPPFNSGHWNPELVETAGAVDVLGPHGQPSTTIDWAQVLRARPDVVLLSVCGFGIQRTMDELAAIQSDPAWQAVDEQVQHKVLVMDGDAYFSRPGPRLVDALEGLAHALHPQIHPQLPSAAATVWLNQAAQ